MSVKTPKTNLGEYNYPRSGVEAMKRDKGEGDVIYGLQNPQNRRYNTLPKAGLFFNLSGGARIKFPVNEDKTLNTSSFQPTKIPRISVFYYLGVSGYIGIVVPLISGAACTPVLGIVVTGFVDFSLLAALSWHDARTPLLHKHCLNLPP